MLRVFIMRAHLSVGLHIGLAIAGLLAISNQGHSETPGQLNAQKPGAIAAPMVVSYHRSDANDKQNHFQFDLIERALEVTRPEYGGFILRPYGGAPTAKRQAILIGEGKLMNIQWASPGTPIAQAEVIPIRVNILRGLLGLRICLINRADLPRFAQIQSLDDLRQIKIGQGQDWTDTLIYQLNRIPLFESAGLQQLFPILTTHRIDCLPLGANEIGVKYAEQQQQHPDMVIEPELLLYYNFPTYLYVSKHHPRLAERVAAGLQIMQTSGEYDRLFWHHFGHQLVPLKLSQRRIICLKSPYAPEAEQCQSPVTLPDFTPPPGLQAEPAASF